MAIQQAVSLTLQVTVAQEPWLSSNGLQRLMQARLRLPRR